jgi:hypothetical protein
VFVLEEGIPSLRKGIHIQEETTDTLADQVIARTSQDSRRRWICIQAVARIVRDQDPIKNVPKNGRKFTIGVPKRLIDLSMLIAKVPQRIDVQKCREAQCNEKCWYQTLRKYGLATVCKEGQRKKAKGNQKCANGRPAKPQGKGLAELCWRL